MWPAPPGGGEGYPGEGWRAMGGRSGLIALYGESGMLRSAILIGFQRAVVEHINNFLFLASCSCL
ncbi:MAG TPA: hypothetical protein PLY52_10815 [Methanothrix sp.]|jgi:hypothetical protein|uniref:hypothetical protein n=1 Tax=Methanothrix sp. TaxID=90426 RepID=UPI002D03305C|nr:hypothetical protein [Methanothrix sp.]HON36783.1 hypothetical protein [Methanothrix sp.]HRU76444.1 hypothetical protein [Methanothrix sp.]